MQQPAHRPLVVSLGHWFYMKLRNREAEFYRADPVGYERIVGELDSRHAVAERYAATIRDYFPDRKAQLIVDLACGTGILCAALSKVADRVIGADLNEGMLAIARAKNLPNVELITADFHDLSAIADQSADAVTQYAAARYIRDADQHHREIARVLKPDGIAIVSYYEARGKLNEMLAAAERAGLSVDRRMDIPRPAMRFVPKLLGYWDQSIWVLTRG